MAHTTLTRDLPLLRRYARALTGSQQSGDAFVTATLEALVEDDAMLDPDLDSRVALYKAFHAIWSTAFLDGDEAADTGRAAKAHERLRVLTPIHRQALLLSTVEGFSIDETASIIGIERAQTSDLVVSARADVEAQTRARILIIEDELLIAVDLADIVERQGHEVVATVDTASKAVSAAKEHRPDLILADIQLADGSSGIDAVKDILEQFRIPVIFVTAFPQRLLTGERPEPTFLITKPYQEHVVGAAVSQALFFQSTDE